MLPQLRHIGWMVDSQLYTEVIISSTV